MISEAVQCSGPFHPYVQLQSLQSPLISSIRAAKSAKATRSACILRYPSSLRHTTWVLRCHIQPKDRRCLPRSPSSPHLAPTCPTTRFRVPVEQTLPHRQPQPAFTVSTNRTKSRQLQRVQFHRPRFPNTRPASVRSIVIATNSPVESWIARNARRYLL